MTKKNEKTLRLWHCRYREPEQKELSHVSKKQKKIVCFFFCTGRDRNQTSTCINSLWGAACLPFQNKLYIATGHSHGSAGVSERISSWQSKASKNSKLVLRQVFISWKNILPSLSLFHSFTSHCFLLLISVLCMQESFKQGRVHNRRSSGST